MGQIFTIPALWIWCSDLEPFTLPNFQELAPLVSSGSAFTIPKLTLTYLDMKLFLNFPWSKTKTWLRFVDDFGDKNTCDVIGSIVSTSVGKLSGCKPASDHVLEWKWKTLVLITHRLAYLCCQWFIMTFGNKYTKGNWFVILRVIEISGTELLKCLTLVCQRITHNLEQLFNLQLRLS